MTHFDGNPQGPSLSFSLFVTAEAFVAGLWSAGFLVEVVAFPAEAAAVVGAGRSPSSGSHFEKLTLLTVS
jgi:hypothetical protein